MAKHWSVKPKNAGSIPAVPEHKTGRNTGLFYDQRRIKMFVTVRVSLQPNTTEERAKELGNEITDQIHKNTNLSYTIDKVRYAVDEGDGNYLGP